MTYALIENGTIVEYPIYEGDIKLRFPNTSFPVPFEPPAGYEAVADVIPPQIDYTQTIKEEKPEYVNGVLTRVWVVENASSELVAERTQAKAREVRAARNNRLANCDWTQLPDSPVNKAEWAVYRQELRDITGQDSFPWTIIWPDEP